jgi:hypothetical protein
MTKMEALRFLAQCVILCSIIEDKETMEACAQESTDIISNPGYWEAVSHLYLGYRSYSYTHRPTPS